LTTFADIAFPTPVRKLFTYSVSSEFTGELREGMRVWVPLRGTMTIGMVVHIHNKKPSFKTLPVQDILDDEPVLSEELLRLTNWVHRFYYCSWGEVIQAALPSGLNFVSRKYLKVTHLENPLAESKEREIAGIIREEKLSRNEAEKRWKNTGYAPVFKNMMKKGVIEVWEQPEQKVRQKTEKQWVWVDKNLAREVLKENRQKKWKWIQALEALLETDLPESYATLTGREEFSAYTLNRIAEEGIIESKDVAVNTFKLSLKHDPAAIKKLNEEQETAYEEIRKSLDQDDYHNFLLFGITGSGKTEVYIHAIRHALEQQKGALVLLPEIALTPQTVSRFYTVFGDEIAVLHSRMSDRERADSWKLLKQGKRKIAIGARSAVFAPVNNLGIIIVDEEHDSSFKQEDPAPRYHAREVAAMRAHHRKAIIVTGSATPSMNSIHLAGKGKSKLLELKNRHAASRLPDVSIVDLTQYRSAMRGPLAIPLFEAVGQALDNNEQVILLHNRRGFSNYLQCEECGHIPQSPECSVSLTYHKKKNILLCHYSGYSRKADTKCEKCGSEELFLGGTGTQQIEEEIARLFPKASLLRMDRDTTSGKYDHERLINTFFAGRADILIGTQLVAKGLDFPNVTVVGVIDADTEMAFPSFQSTERTYQLLSQVSGRAGRSSKPGRVFIQTRKPDTSALKYVKHHEYKLFAREELGFRKALHYPPYSRLIGVVFKGKKEREVQRSAMLYAQSANAVLEAHQVLGPSPSSIFYMNREFVWELLLKISNKQSTAYIEGVLDAISGSYHKHNPPAGVRVNIDVGRIR